jgi:D-glycero-D-manno-heptose 1,7-bisphosphate phosphatase
MTKAVLMDRDGVINEIVCFPELGVLDSPLNPDQFNLLPRVPKAIKNLNGLGLKVIIVSNQPVIAKGKTTKALFKKIREKMTKQLQTKGAFIDGEYYCFHHPQAKLEEYRVLCGCRKPAPGLLLEAAKDFDLDLTKCYMVGDSLIDVEAGKKVGCKTILIGKMKCDLCKLMDENGFMPDWIVNDLCSASKIIAKEERKND